MARLSLLFALVLAFVLFSRVIYGVGDNDKEEKAGKKCEVCLKLKIALPLVQVVDLVRPVYKYASYCILTLVCQLFPSFVYQDSEIFIHDF